MAVAFVYLIAAFLQACFLVDRVGAALPSSAEDALEAQERYPQDKLIREQKERGSDEPPTIIPFTLELAQAADGSADT